MVNIIKNTQRQNQTVYEIVGESWSLNTSKMEGQRLTHPDFRTSLPRTLKSSVGSLTMRRAKFLPQS